MSARYFKSPQYVRKVEDGIVWARAHGKTSWFRDAPCNTPEGIINPANEIPASEGEIPATLEQMIAAANERIEALTARLDRMEAREVVMETAEPEWRYFEDPNAIWKMPKTGKGFVRGHDSAKWDKSSYSLSEMIVERGAFEITAEQGEPTTCDTITIDGIDTLADTLEDISAKIHRTALQCTAGELTPEEASAFIREKRDEVARAFAGF